MTNSPNSQKIFVFGDFRIEDESQTFWCADKEVHLANRPFQVLVFLIENRQRVVSRDELLDKFWEGHDVYDDALRKAVGTIRKALNDLKKPPQFIETRYGSGFRFIGEVEEIHKNSNGKLIGFKSNLGENNKNDLISKSNQQRFPYILTMILLTSVLFFTSLGFYIYFPNENENLEAQKNLPQSAATVRSIAVLPLKNLTGDAINEYFSDGITESIITELSRVQELKVISRSSTFALKDKELDPREVGRKLNVDALLEGSLQKKSDLLSVNVRLISTKDGSVLWTSQDFVKPIVYAYELQDTISCNIAIELRRELCDALPRQNTNNSNAYQSYLKGRFQWNKRTGEGIKKSIEFYNQALNLDSKYALAYAGLAESYLQGIWYVPFDSKEVLPKAEKAARTAIELDDSLAEAHTALASVYLLDWKWSESESELHRAIELNPRYARAHHVQASFYLTLGRNDEAIASIRRAKELDPLNLIVNTDEANMLFIANRADEAFEQWKKTLELDPNSVYTYRERSIAYQVLGNESASIEDYSKFLELNGESAEKIVEYRQTASTNGLKAIWRKNLNEILAKEKRGEKISFITPAVFYTLLGEKDEAFKYLEKAYNDHSAEMVLLKPYTVFAPLRSDSRYKDLLKRMKLPE